MKSYKDLEIYQEAFDLAVEIYRQSIQLPQPDKFETGNQIRRSSQSIKDNIAEGYGRRKYKADFIKFLTYSYASLLEAKSQSEFLYEINRKQSWKTTTDRLDRLGIKIFNFRNYVINNWKT